MFKIWTRSPKSESPIGKGWHYLPGRLVEFQTREAAEKALTAYRHRDYLDAEFIVSDLKPED